MREKPHPRATSDLNLPTPAELAVRFVRRGGQDLAVLSFELRELEVPPVLSEAEQHVIAGVLRGWSNARIASERGRAVRTIANQLAAVFRKLEVHSRRELVARYSSKLAQGRGP